MLRKHLISYRYAVRGMWLAFRYENNMKIHAVAGVVVIGMNFIMNVTNPDWVITIMLIGIVMTAELFNTAIEKLADRVTIEKDPLIGKVKDLAAGAVLIVCIAALVCAAIIYYPYITSGE